MRLLTVAEQHEQVAEIAMQHYRDSMLLIFPQITEGLPKQLRKEAKKIVSFFEQETDANVWAQLATIPDPDDPMRSLADSWIQQWERLDRAVVETAGKRSEPSEPRAETPEQTTGGY